jgi:MFS family permease
MTAALIKPMVWTAPIPGLFDARQGLAMSLALCGTGLASALAPIFAERLIEDFRWRAAYYALGGGWALVTLPLLLLFFSDSGGRAGALRRSSVQVDLPGLDVAPGLRSSWFVKLFATTFLATLLIVSLMVHLVPILVGGGLSSARAAQIAGISGIASIVGRIVTGFLLDRWHGRWIGGTVFLLPCLACIILLSVGIQVWSAALVACLLGLSIGAELNIAAYLSSRYFGRRNYAMLFGAIASMLSLGTAIGPLLAARVFDMTGSYTPWLWAMIPVGLIASALVASLGAYPDYSPLIAGSAGTQAGSN